MKEIIMEPSTTDKPDAVSVDTPVNPLPGGGDHDRVAMLSLNVDGSPAQHNPELIGDRDATLAATTKQFEQQAVSAADSQRQADAVKAAAVDAPQDPSIAEAKAEHDAVAATAAEAAKAVVEDLLPVTDPAPAGTDSELPDAGVAAAPDPGAAAPYADDAPAAEPVGDASPKPGPGVAAADQAQA
jgi:hypothetical protein